jgi:hypothetical protein
LLITRRWISWRPMNGPTLGWLAMWSSAARSEAVPPVPAGIVRPRKRFSDSEWCSGYSRIGVQLAAAGICSSKKFQLQKRSAPGPASKPQPENTLARPSMSAPV